jgi:hypothetical protein
MQDPIASNLIDRLQEQIRLANAKGDFAEVARLAVLATEANELLNEARHLDEELASITASLPAFQNSAPTPFASDGPSGISSPDPVPKPHILDRDESSDANALRTSMGLLRSQLEVVMDWSAAGYNLSKEVIACRRPTATLRLFVERIWQVMGPEKLALLHAVRTGRGPLVSRRPEEEFVNRAQNTLYAHHSIGDSGWFVLTHSETKDKIDHIRQAAELMGLSVVVNSADRHESPTSSSHDEEDADQI